MCDVTYGPRNDAVKCIGRGKGCIFGVKDGISVFFDSKGTEFT